MKTANGMYRLIREIPIEDRYDVVVAGGGPAGTAAAVCAARLGSKVLLVEATGCLGGMGTSGLVCAFDPMADGSVRWSAGTCARLWKRCSPGDSCSRVSIPTHGEGTIIPFRQHRLEQGVIYDDFKSRRQFPDQIGVFNFGHPPAAISRSSRRPAVSAELRDSAMQITQNAG